MSFVKSQWFNNNGIPCAGCLLYTYDAGTSTPLATYEDAAETTPNSNPVVLDASGRATIFLGAASYKFVMTLANGTQLWTVDGVNASNLLILSTDNVWSGTNTFDNTVTFNSTVTMNDGFTANGPAILTDGGTFSGSFAGSPSFTGTPNFANGFTDTVATGTPPFTVDSTTQVNNLNAGLLNGCTWAAPCAIGTTTPNTAIFTALQANTNFVLNSSTPQTGIAGTDSSLLSAGVISGTGAITAAVPHSGDAGTGFNVGDLLSVMGGGGTGGVIKVAAVTAGVPTSYTVVNQGSGYANTGGAALSVLTGTGVAGEADITASSGTVGAPLCTDAQGGATTVGCPVLAGVGALASTTISGTTISDSSATSIGTLTVAQPASPCTWRIVASYTFGFHSGSNQAAVSAAIWDGTNAWGAAGSTGSSNGADGAESAESWTGQSPTYNSSTSTVTLTLYAQSTTTTDPTLRTATPISFGSPISGTVPYKFQAYGICME